MKKRLFILPLIAFTSGILAACGGEEDQPAPPAPVTPDDPVTPVHKHKYVWEHDNEKHWQKCSCGDIIKEGQHMSFDKDGLCDDCGYRISLNTSKLAPETILDGALKRVTKIEDGKTYYLVVCKYNENGRLMFINGEPHKDIVVVDKKEEERTYPFYMSETEVTEEAQLSDVATVTVDFKDGSDKYFNMQVNKSGATNDGKYIGLYKSTATSGPCLSIHCADEIGETYHDPNDDETKEKECHYDFEWIDEYNDYELKTFCSMIQDERKEEQQPKPRFFGTGSKFVSVDCADESKAFNADYNFAYFYEVVSEE